jgi:hypothetical protein
VEPAEPSKQAVGAPLRWEQTCPQKLEDGTILVISSLKFCVTNSFIMFNSVLKKASTGAEPHYLDVWQPAHQGNVDTTEMLVSIAFYSYTLFVTSILNSISCKTDIRRS